MALRRLAEQMVREQAIGTSRLGPGLAKRPEELLLVNGGVLRRLAGAPLMPNRGVRRGVLDELTIAMQ
eukprot:2139369-Alexandrium_andersonii.AAC.1